MLRKIFISAVLISFLAIPTLALAITPPPSAVEGDAIKLSDIEDLVMDILDSLVFVASLLVVGVFVYAGLLWLTAGDNQTKVTKAKTLFKNAVIGAVIVFGVGVIINTIADFATSPTDIVR